MIAAQLDTALIGSTCYGRIRNPSNPGQVWSTALSDYADFASVTVDNMAITGTVDASGFFTAEEPSGFSASENASVTIHEREGASRAFTDPCVGTSLTNFELTTEFTLAHAVLLAAAATQSDINELADAIDDVYSAVSDLPEQITIDTAGTRVSAFLVDPDHTFKFRKSTELIANNTLSEMCGFDALLAMDFSNPIPDLSTLHSIISISIELRSGEPTSMPTVGDIDDWELSPDKLKVHIPLTTELGQEGTYRIFVKARTTDSQDYQRAGDLILEAGPTESGT
jgi:hypothetical protein